MRDDPEVRGMLDLAIECAVAVDAVVGRLDAGPSVVAASGAHLAELQALAAAGETSGVTCDRVMIAFERLDRLLTLAVAASSERARLLADRIAVQEEFDLHPADEPFTAARAAGLAHDLAERTDAT